jgi:hypothetical protein
MIQTENPTAELLSEPASDSSSAEGAAQCVAPWAHRLNYAFGPVAAGVTLDLMDLATFGPVGLVLGIPFGGLAGYWMGSALRLDRYGVIFCAVLGAIYCTIPFTEVLPLGTLVGALVRYQNPELFDTQVDEIDAA